MSQALHRRSWKGFLSLSAALQTVIGVGLAVFALKGFMVPNHLLDGGVIGISILSSEVTDLNLSLFLLVGNIPFVVLAWVKVSRAVALKSMLAIVLLGAGLEFIHIDPVTTNEVLIALFGGAILGVGVGLVIRAGGAVDGTEILALLTTRRIGLSTTEVILAINVILFGIAGAVFDDIEVVMYSIITYFTAGKAIDYVVDGVEEYTALTIIASQSDEVKHVIVNNFGKGITVYRGERGYLPGSFDHKTECDIIVTIVTRLELLSIKKAIHIVDPTAFMYVSSIKEASGGVIKKRGHDR